MRYFKNRRGPQGHSAGNARDFNPFLAEKRYGELIVLMLKRDLKRLPESLDQEVLAAMPGDADEATVVAGLRGDALT